jgi:N-acetylglucosamine-6-phosphate deacetylase
MATTVLYNARVYTGITQLENSAVVIEDDRIVDVFSHARFKQKIFDDSVKLINLEGLIVAPGFIDTHIHGIGGFGTDDYQAESIIAMSQFLVRYGVTSFLPTLYPAEPGNLLKSIEETVKAMGHERGARILGIHSEGPFISQERRGVQRAEYIQEVNRDFAKQMFDLGQDKIKLMTLAPELKHMRDLALYCNKKGTILSAGHTDATYDQMVEGFQAGILHATHMFNAMKNLHHRDPGAVGALLLHTNVSVEIIADGFHVHPALIELLMRSKPLDKIVLVTDSLKPTAQTQGQLIANGEEVYLDQIGVFRRVKDDVIAGSSLTMIQGVKNLVSFDIPLEDAIQMASSNPADLLGLHKQRGYLLPNSFADLVVFDSSFNVIMTFVEGKLVYEREM